MSQPIVDFGSNGNWQQVFDEFRSAVVVTDRDIIPIPAFEVGVLFESPLLAVRCLSPTAKATWKFAGTLSQRFPLGTGGVASSLPIVTGSVRSLRLNRTALVQFDLFTNTYELLFEPPSWLKDIRVTVWEYVGEVSDTTSELIETVKIDVARVENKIDSLNY